MNTSTVKKFKLLLFPFIILLAFIILNKNLKHIETEAVMVKAPWALTTTEVEQKTVSRGFSTLGYVQSGSEVRVSPRISGTVLALGPRTGGHVNKGDLLLHIDTQELEAGRDGLISKLKSAKATAKYNRKELQRERQLQQQGGSTASAVEQRSIQLQADLANIRTLKQQIRQTNLKIGYGHIYAPMDAGISGRYVEVGDGATLGKTMYTLSAQQGGRVVVNVPLQTLSRIQLGGEVELSHGQKTMMTKITRINPRLDTFAMGSLEIDLLSRPFGLPDGAPVAARVFTERFVDALTVPEHALLPSTSTNQRMLFKVIQHGAGYKLKKIALNLQVCGPEGCAVTGDLQVGDRVVVAHASVLLKLKDADAVFGDFAGRSSQ